MRFSATIKTARAEINSVLTIGSRSRNRPRLTPEGFVAHRRPRELKSTQFLPLARALATALG